MAQFKDYYQNNAEEFFQQTLAIDMAPLRARFLEHIPKNGRLLDAGCGSGRDARAFLDLGYQVHAFDSAPGLARLASNFLNQPVDMLRFQELKYKEEFDGIWARASLLHVPQTELTYVNQPIFRNYMIAYTMACSYR